ncbi:MAG: zinc ribbon domain-containing protein [Clostridiaceae bacterium]|nr:zinc ribbon domain-containing protein [Clostridiaceae bacterium]
MKKGKFGLSPAAIAVIAFIFVLLRQPIAVLLICGFALLAEKDEWLNRQTIQALLLMIAYYVADLIQGWIFGGLATFFGWVKLFKVASVMATISSIVGTILYLALAVFSVIAIIKLLGGKDAGLPLISQIASGDFVIKEKRRPAPAPVQPQYAAPAPPQESAPVQPQYAAPAPPQEPAPVQQQYAAPVPPPAPVVEEAPAPVPAAPAPSTSFCANCGAPMHEGAVFCAECGTKVG